MPWDQPDDGGDEPPDDSSGSERRFGAAPPRTAAISRACAPASPVPGVLRQAPVLSVTVPGRSRDGWREGSSRTSSSARSGEQRIS